MAKGRDVAGNSVASAAEFQRLLLRAGERLLSFERIADRMWEAGEYLGNITIKPKSDERAEYLLIIRMRRDGLHLVAFVADDTLSGVLARAVSMLENKSIKWKEDSYADGN